MQLCPSRCIKLLFKCSQIFTAFRLQYFFCLLAAKQTTMTCGLNSSGGGIIFPFCPFSASFKLDYLQVRRGAGKNLSSKYKYYRIGNTLQVGSVMIQELLS